MRHTDDLGLEEYVAALAVSRIVLGPKVRLQAPPNLVDLEECRALLGAGVDDWGGVSPLTPDHVNPERPWPSLDRLRAVTEAAGFTLRARLTAHPEYVVAGEPWIDPRDLRPRRGPGRRRRPAARRREADRAALAGARRRVRRRRPRRPARRGRHRGPHRGPPIRLRRRLRRLGRGRRRRRPSCRSSPPRRSTPPRRSSLSRPHPLHAPPPRRSRSPRRRERPRQPLRRARPDPDDRRGRRCSTRSAAWPTTCAARSWATT